MFTINADTNIKDFIKVYNIVPTDICKSIVSGSDSFAYDQHKWNDVYDHYHTGDSKDFDRVKLDKSRTHILSPFIDLSIKKYTEDLGLSFKFSGKSSISFNRYHTGTRMRSHIDHIRSIFDGETKGIPIFTILGVLNNEFKGGKLRFWESTVYDLSIGDVIIFPSVFMYPHSVTEITEGTRYSFVLWIY